VQTALAWVMTMSVLRHKVLLYLIFRRHACSYDSLSSWLVSAAQVKKDVVKDHCKSIAARLERISASQRAWDMPDGTMRSRVTAAIRDLLLEDYVAFWTAYQEHIKILQKHCKCGVLLTVPCCRRCIVTGNVQRADRRFVLQVLT
jgi:Exo70 exocyst complex subunit